MEWADGTCRFSHSRHFFCSLPLRPSAIRGGSPSWCVGGGDSCFECNDCCFVVEAKQKDKGFFSRCTGEAGVVATTELHNLS